MFRRPKKQPRSDNTIFPLRRRKLVNPERLESRDLPGVCIVSPSLSDTLSASNSQVSCVAAYDATSSKSTSVATVTGSVTGSQNDIPTTVPLCFPDTSNSSEEQQINPGPSAETTKPSATVSAASTSASISVRSLLSTNSVSRSLSLQQPIPNRTTAPEANSAVKPPVPYAASKAAGGDSGGGSGGTSGGGASAAGSGTTPPSAGQPAAMKAASFNASSAAAAVQSNASQSVAQPSPVSAVGPIITASEVSTFLDRAAAATNRNDAIIAVVDRAGQILGVRVETGVPIALNSPTMVFAIDGAVAKARTAAFFSNDQAPLTSRTIRFISQTTITQREVQSNPNSIDPQVKGPGFVAPVGIGGTFPPGVSFTPLVDLFAIEHTNRDSVIHAGDNGVRENGGGDDVNLATRFGADFIPGQEIAAPESYGLVSGKLLTAQSRGIATLPGGVPLFKADPNNGNALALVGGIGVFFPGPDGYATFEQDFQTAAARKAAHKKPQTDSSRVNAPLVKQAEYMAVAAAGGVGTIGGIPLPAGYTLPTGRIDLAGIKLEIYGNNPRGLKSLLKFGKKIGAGTLAGGVNMPVDLANNLFIDGESVPEGWLVAPHASGNLSAADVEKIIEDGIAEADKDRAAIRLPLGRTTKMMLSVTDTNGEILGLYRMHDATFFSIDVSVAKARNVAYYDDAAALQPQDEIAGVPPGTAFTNRTFRFVAAPFFPSGSKAPSGPFSILNDPGINPKNGENTGAPTPANQFQTALGYDSFNPGTNFHELNDPNAVTGNQNGVVFFPGSTPLYKNGQLVGGFGISGDGVDQDDVVTFVGGGAFIPQPGGSILRADQVSVRSVKLPYQKFNRNPHGGV